MYSPSLCAPSRRALFTGRDFQQHGAHNNECPSVPLNMKLLPSELDRAGYKVGVFGKWHLGFLQEEALPGNKGIEHARVFMAGSVDHQGHYSNGRGYNDCPIESGARRLSHVDAGDVKGYLFDHTVTNGYKDHFNGADAGYQFLTNPANRPTQRCATCSEGDGKWGESGADTQHLGSYMRDLAIERIANHDFENKDSPLALFLTWSGPHLPHTPEGLVTSAQVEAAHCAQEIADGNSCSGDQYFSQQRFAQRQFSGSGFTARSGPDCEIDNPNPFTNYAHSSYQAMVAEISLYIGKIKEALVAKTDSTTATMWDETLMVYQSDNGGTPTYVRPHSDSNHPRVFWLSLCLSACSQNYPMRGVRDARLKLAPVAERPRLLSCVFPCFAGQVHFHGGRRPRSHCPRRRDHSGRHARHDQPRLHA
jgi:arylsulfatase A-like enzyme